MPSVPRLAHFFAKRRSWAVGKAFQLMGQTGNDGGRKVGETRPVGMARHRCNNLSRTLMPGAKGREIVPYLLRSPVAADPDLDPAIIVTAVHPPFLLGAGVAITPSRDHPPSSITNSWEDGLLVRGLQVRLNRKKAGRLRREESHGWSQAQGFSVLDSEFSAREHPLSPALYTA
jgi:hypothetical protein